MSFSIIELAGDRTLIKGTDLFGSYGEQVLDASQWNGLKEKQVHAQLHSEFDQAVTDFYGPLIAAAESLERQHEVTVDPLFYVVEQEKSDGVAPQAEVLTHLSTDSVILRLVEQGTAEQRLAWVNGSLEILAQPTAPASQTPVFDGIVDDTATD